VQVRSQADTQAIVAKLESEGFATLDLTADEMAKLHLRHLVGGRSPVAQEELLYRFEFPERPGELTRFLNSMHPNWNISLFHYRNHGADYGRILIGIEVPEAEREDWQEFLRRSEYTYWEETSNPAYRLFLG
jgi:threonine dehydratase